MLLEVSACLNETYSIRRQSAHHAGRDHQRLRDAIAPFFLGNVRHDAQSEPHRLGPIALVAGRNAQRESLTRDAFCPTPTQRGRSTSEPPCRSRARRSRPRTGSASSTCLPSLLAFRNEPLGAIYIDRPTTNVGFTDQDASVFHRDRPSRRDRPRDIAHFTPRSRRRGRARPAPTG